MEENTVTTEQTVEATAQDTTETSTPTFDDVLSNKEYQSEFDRRIAKALEKQRAKLEAEYEKRLSTAKTEAEKLAQMDAQQKAQYEAEQREKILSEREAALTRRELQSVAKEQLIGKGLPTELVGMLDFTSAEACSKSIEDLAISFQSAVGKAVEDKLRGSSSVPKSAPNKGGASLTKEDLKRLSRKEIQAIPWDELQNILRG